MDSSGRVYKSELTADLMVTTEENGKLRISGDPAHVREVMRKMGMVDIPAGLIQDICAMNHHQRRAAYANIRKELKKRRKKAG